VCSVLGLMVAVLYTEFICSAKDREIFIQLSRIFYYETKHMMTKIELTVNAVAECHSFLHVLATIYCDKLMKAAISWAKNSILPVIP
jgi:hypothetical protein